MSASHKSGAVKIVALDLRLPTLKRVSLDNRNLLKGWQPLATILNAPHKSFSVI